MNPRSWFRGPTLRASLALLALAPLLGCDAVSEVRARAELERIAAVYEAGDVEAAIPQLEAHVRTYPKDSLAWTILGHAYEDLDRDEDALAAYEAALALDPRSFQAITGKGILHRKRGEYEKAMAAYREAVAIDPSYAQAYSSMAVIALKQERDAEALEHAQKAYDLDPEDPTIAANLAVACHYHGDFACRDRLTRVAAELGYPNVATLERIYDGELTVRD